MESASTRLMAATGCLALVWIGAYWLYEPSGKGSDGIAPLPDSLNTPLPAARSGLTNPEQPAKPAPSQPASEPASQPLPQPSPAKPPTAVPGAAAPTSAVIPPEFETYTVKPGETFETIAKARYGSSRLHTAIANANPMKDPRRLKPGDQIRLPKDPTNIQGKPATPTPSGQPATTTPGLTQYLVVKGDTLSGIAQKVWGSSKDWRLIMDANKALLPDEDALRPGMKLRIPAKP